MANLNYVQLQKTTLSGAGVSATATSITLSSFALLSDNTNTSTLLTMTMFGLIGYGTLEPATTREENISFTGITQNSDGTATLTGVVRGLQFVTPYSTASNYVFPHAGGSVFIITDNAPFLSTLANKNNDEVITGQWTVPDPVSNTGIANKEYVLSVVSGGTVSFSSQIIAGTSAAALTKGQFVYLNSSNQWALTSAAAAATSVGIQLGITQTTVASSGLSISVLISGVDTNQSGLSTGTVYYLSNSNGAISSSAGTFSVSIGQALGATSILFNQSFGITNSVTTTPTANAVPRADSTGKISQEWLLNNNADTDQSQTTQDSSIQVGEANATTKHNSVAQSFIPTKLFVRGFQLYKAADTGTFTGTVTVAIQADSAGSPSGSALASYVISNANWLLIPAGTFDVAFSAQYQMTIGTKYWIVVTTSTADNSNHPNIGTSSAGGYANGLLKYNNTTDGWVTTALDLYFQTLQGVLSEVVISNATTGLISKSLLAYALVDFDTTSSTLANSTTETTVYTKTLPANFFRTSTGLTIRINGDYETDAGSGSQVTINVKINGTSAISFNVPTAIANAHTFSGDLNILIVNQASLSSQKAYASGILGLTSTIGATSNPPAIKISSATTSAIDTSGICTVQITMKNTAANINGVWTYNAAIIEKIG